MAISVNPDFSDVLSGGLVQGVITVTTTSIEAKVGSSRQIKRQALRIFNNSSLTIFWGNSSVTSSNGEPLLPKQWVNIPVGDQVAVHLITASGSASDIRIQEWF
jgi:hypothetical protein